jgi:hypothetical protein
MELLKAALLGLVAAVALPMVFGGPSGAWMNSFRRPGHDRAHGQLSRAARLASRPCLRDGLFLALLQLVQPLDAQIFRSM